MMLALTSVVLWDLEFGVYLENRSVKSTDARIKAPGQLNSGKLRP